MRWGPGLGVPPERKWTDHFDKAHGIDIHEFDSDEAERDFAEAALRAVRALISKTPDWPATETDKASLKQAEERARQALNRRQARGYSASGWEVTRRRILERDNFACKDCGEQSSVLLCTHIVPPSQGGDDSDSNLITRCRPCFYLAQKNVRGQQPITPSPGIDDDCPF
jgi:5-methylcytosine-specific restriction endonuclease McrA